MLKEAKGNMYGFITHTWNPIKGNYPIPLDNVHKMVLCGLIAKRLYGRTHKHEKSNLRQTAEK